MKTHLFLCSLVMITCVACSSSTDTGGEDVQNANNSNLLASEECVNGFAGSYACNNVNLLAVIPPDELLGDRLNDIWGWTDPETGKEYALVGLTDGVSFVDISDPEEPVVVGKLPESVGSSGKLPVETHHPEEDNGENKSAWRDIKVYDHFAFVVSDLQEQPHGVQVFDLRKLRDVEDPPVTFSEDALYEGIDIAHNIAINEESAYAYVAGYDETGGLYVLDIRQPLDPEFVGSFEDSSVGRGQTGYVHDTQCVNYQGADDRYVGSEICFNSSETHFLIADVTEKSDMQTISRADYEGSSYVHQGWLTEDHNYFLLNDEGDERENGTNTRTYIWDVRDLEDPEMIGYHEFASGNIDHNLYVKDNYVYEANYTNGLRILSLDDIENGNLSEVAYFDTYPDNDGSTFNGAWSVYPFFESGMVVVSDITGGLFVLEPEIE